MPLWHRRDRMACAAFLAAALLPLLCSFTHARPHVSTHAVGIVDAAAVTWTVDTSTPLVNVSQDMWGVFFEEMNHGGTGGIYHEQIHNANFEFGAISALYDPWYLLPTPTGVTAFIALNQDNPLNAYNPYSIYVQSSGGTGTVGIANPGFWGINTNGIASFTVSFWAFMPSPVAGLVLQVSLISADGNTTYAVSSVSGIITSWQKFTTTIEIPAGTTDTNAHFAITWPSTGTTRIYFDVFSVMPAEGWNGLSFLRPDLAQRIADMHPSFVRFPGGCYVEGDVLNDRFNWKTTIGPVENRRGHWGIWDYYSEDHLGIFEYFSFVEKLTDAYGNPTRAIWVVNSGDSHHQWIPADNLGQWVQDALDSIEFIMGPATSRYGSIRASMGHPEPFNLSYIAIGNEGDHLPNWKQNYAPNYAVFYAALKAAYPQLTYIANADMTPLKMPTELYDYHIYTSSGYFLNNTNLFDSWSRNGAKIFNSEYAVTEGCGNGNAIAGIGEAAWMTGLERNSDLITTASYAPLFVNINDRTWNPDAIVFDTYRVYGTPSYWTQWIFANANQGVQVGTLQTLSYSVTAGSPLFAIATWGALNSSLAIEKDATIVIIVKVVNWYNGSVPTTIDLTNLASGGSLNPSADVWTLAASSETQENTFDEPTAIAPVATTVKVPSTSFAYTFAALSTTVIRIYATL